VYCINCGKMIKLPAKYCDKCGWVIEAWEIFLL
jgi:rRNA maturation endonuclease Nob1